MGTITDKLNKLLASKNAIKAAITEKTGEDAGDVMSTYADKILSISGGGSVSSAYTGHADSEGLKAIGWTDEDIAYYQKHGVNWNEEDDQYHLVSDENKAMYGVINADNVSDFADELIYLPKIDTSGRKSLNQLCLGCKAMVAIPMIDTSSATSVQAMFESCYSLQCVPLLDFSNVTNISRLFYNCYSLTSFPPFNTSKATGWGFFCRYAYALQTIPDLDTSAATNISYIFANCSSLSLVRPLECSKVTSLTSPFSACNSTRNIFLIGLKTSLVLSSCTALTKDSLVYIINNASTSSEITITLAANSYTKYAEDAVVLAALENHPNISLASA